MSLTSKLSTFNDKIHHQIAGDNGLIFLTATATIEYAIISTLASKSYIYNTLSTFELSGTMALWIACITLGYILMVGIYDYISRIVDMPYVEYVPGNIATFILSIYVSFFISFFTIYRISLNMGYEFIYRNHPYIEYFDILSLLVFYISLFLLVSKKIAPVGVIEYLILFSIYASMICFYSSAYLDSSIASLKNKIEYCATSYKLLEDENFYLNGKMCKGLNIGKENL